MPFEAKFSIFGELDDEQRSQIEKLEKLTRQYLDVDDFEIAREDASTEITIDGTLPVVYGTAELSSAWAIAITDVDDAQLAQVFPYQVQLVTGAPYDAFAAEAKDVNVMLAPDASQPLRFRLRANEDSPLRVLAGGFETNGEGHAIAVLTVQAGSRPACYSRMEPTRPPAGAFSFHCNSAGRVGPRGGQPRRSTIDESADEQPSSMWRDLPPNPSRPAPARSETGAKGLSSRVHCHVPLARTGCWGAASRREGTT